MADVSFTSPTAPTFYFIGVTTGQSSSRRMFPLWMQALGQPNVQLAGIDLKIHAHPDSYRWVVGHIKREPLALGALVTTHKLDPLVDLTNEVSSIAKDNGRLVGRATDPIAGGLSLDAILGQDYFVRTGGHVLLLGAGGSTVALSLHLLQKSRPDDRPRHIMVVNRSAGRLTRLQQMVTQFNTDIQFDYVHNDIPQRNDRLLAALPPGSMVINATGMGKDTPGSPLTGDALFSQSGVAWELNYRGELDFLRHAQAQQSDRSLTVADGWAILCMAGRKSSRMSCILKLTRLLW